MRRFVAAFLAVLPFAIGPAVAAERLLVPELSGWKVVDSHTDGVADVTELIPAGESAETWSRRVTVQAFRVSAMGANAFLDGLAARTEEVCDGFAADPIRPLRMPGAEAGRRTIACGRYKGDGKGVYTLFTAVRGANALYVLSRAWRGEPYHPGGTPPVAAAELAEWAAMSDAVRLCNSDDPARPCPSR